MKSHNKPRISWCWDCGRKLQGRHHTEVKVPTWMSDVAPETTVVMHESCAKLYYSEENNAYSLEYGHENYYS